MSRSDPDRSALLTYLSDLRVLETARELLRANATGRDSRAEGPGAGRMRDRSGVGLASVILPFIGAAAFFAMGWSLYRFDLNPWHDMPSPGSGAYSWQWLLIGAGMALVFLIYGIYMLMRRARQRKSSKMQYARELQPVDALLKRAYDADVIPPQYRNISAVYYLYDRLSSSRESLSEALAGTDPAEIRRAGALTLGQVIIDQAAAIAGGESAGEPQDARLAEIHAQTVRWIAEAVGIRNAQC